MGNVSGLKNHDVFLENSIKYINPLNSLFAEEEWKVIKEDVVQKMELPLEPEPLLAELTTSLDSTYKNVLNTWHDNELCRMEMIKGKERLILKNISKMLETDTSIALKKELSNIVPRPDITEILLEVTQRENYTDCFHHLSGSEPRMKDFNITINAILLSEACNIGLTPVIKNNVPALTRDRLVWAKHNYLRPETITEANNMIVEAHSQLNLSQYFGSGDVASADGLRFSTPVSSIHSGANPKYFGFGKGITYYNFVSDQFSGFHGMVIPGTERDSLYVLEGLLEQTSSLKPNQVMTDTGGYSDIIFGLFALLGYQFSPRIKDSGSSRLWRINKEANYKQLNSLSQNKININLIVKHWDEILNVISSLKLGKVRASDIIKALQRDGRPTSLGRAFTEYGRIFKTMHLLRYYSDEDYCRQILIQLNRGESRHNLCRVICYGQSGKIYKKYQKGQEEMLGALGLITNIVIYWNTLYLEAALEKLKKDGYSIHSEDIYHLSPLIHKHINFIGKYNFNTLTQLKKGELRELNISQSN